MPPETPRTPIMNRRGFTLIELMIVVVIIGIIAALAIPRFGVASYKTREKEADLFLNAVYKAQRSYYAMRGDYASTLPQLEQVGFNPAVTRYYDIPVNYDFPLCLNSQGAWSDRGIDEDGNLTDC
jgi:prepilin-type N-terminal cleavage/methylation domain-containing protein